MRAPAVKAILYVSVRLGNVTKYIGYRVNMDNFNKQNMYDFEEIMTTNNQQHIEFHFGVQHNS